MDTDMTKRNRPVFRVPGAMGVLSICILYLAAPRAEVTPEMLDMSLEELMSVEIVTASKTQRQPQDVTQKVDLIPGTEIARTVPGNRNLAEYLQYLPGASVLVLSRNDANWGAYGGIGPEYMTYMVQGLPVDAFMDPMSIDPAAVDRIEVQRGPASVLYPNYLSQDYAGNQCPLTGTVNLIMDQAFTGPSTRTVATYGSYNTVAASAYRRQPLGKARLSGGISAERSDYTDYGSDGSWLNMEKNPSYIKVKTHLWASTPLDAAGSHTVSVFGNQAFHLGNTGRTYREFDNRYGLLNGVYSGRLSDNIRITCKTGLRSYLRQWQEDDTSAAASGGYRLDKTTGVTQTVVPVDAALTIDHFNHSNFTVGSDYQQTAYGTWTAPAGSSRYTGTDATAIQMGTYAQEELQLSRLTLRAGGRLNIISHDIRSILGGTPGERNRTWHSVLWSAGAKYRIARKYALYANAGNSFLSPGLKAIGGTLPLSARNAPGQDGQLPNPDLKPENGLGLDLGIDGQLPLAVTAGIRAFSTTVSDAIIDNVVSLNPSQTMSANASGRTAARGVELSLSRTMHTGIDWFVNGTFTRTEIIAPDDADQDGNEIPFVPAAIGNAGLTAYLPRGIELTALLHYSGRIYDNASRSGRSSYTPGTLFNLQALKSFNRPAGKTVDIMLDLCNVTDNRFDMPWEFRNTGIQANATVQIIF